MGIAGLWYSAILQSRLYWCVRGILWQSKEKPKGFLGCLGIEFWFHRNNSQITMNDRICLYDTVP